MHDVVVIGAGTVGTAAALALARRGMQVCVLDAQADAAPRAARVFALSHGARLILERLDAWAPIAAADAIEEVHVSQRGRFGHTVLRAAELGLQALGYVVAEPALLAALRERATQAGVAFLSRAEVLGVEADAEHARVRYLRDARAEEAAAQFVAQADGGASLPEPRRTITRDYGQCALTGEIESSRAAPAWAYERFTGKGPIGLLPFRGHHALIWTVPQEEAEALSELEPAAFAAALTQAYGERIGELTLHGALGCFPLQLRFAPRGGGERHVLIGNAAQTLHPVAGQGFNIGLRDAFELAQALADCRRRNQDMLLGVRKYRASRRLDRMGGTLFTDFLVRMFSNDDPVLAAGRSAGLAVFDAAPSLKRFLMRRMIFGARI
jgi:2-octaprenyl-6-methoxyphenol hydroxylase